MPCRLASCLTWTRSRCDDPHTAVGEHAHGPYADPDNADGITLTIPTLEGDHTAREGDWIIRGVKGEFYPCRADIFLLTYEAVTE